MNHSAYKSHTQTCIIIVFSFHCLGYWLIDKYKDVKYVSIYDTIYHLRFGYMVICHNCSLLLVLKVTVFYSKRCHLFSKLNRLHLVQYLSSPTHSLISTLLMIICQKHHFVYVLWKNKTVVIPTILSDIREKEQVKLL